MKNDKYLWTLSDVLSVRDGDHPQFYNVDFDNHFDIRRAKGVKKERFLVTARRNEGRLVENPFWFKGRNPEAEIEKRRNKLIEKRKQLILMKTLTEKGIANEERRYQTLLKSCESPNKSIHIGNLERLLVQQLRKARRTGEVVAEIVDKKSAAPDRAIRQKLIEAWEQSNQFPCLELAGALYRMLNRFFPGWGK